MFCFDNIGGGRLSSSREVSSKEAFPLVTVVYLHCATVDSSEVITESVVIESTLEVSHCTEIVSQKPVIGGFHR